MFGSEVYAHPENYTHMSGQTASDRESVTALRATRGRPNAMVTVHRAAPAGVKTINPGDWVSTSRSYAQQHAMQGAEDGSEDWPVHSASVPAHTVRSGGNDIIEWGYQGKQPVPVTTRQPPPGGWPQD